VLANMIFIALLVAAVSVKSATTFGDLTWGKSLCNSTDVSGNFGCQFGYDTCSTQATIIAYSPAGYSPPIRSQNSCWCSMTLQSPVGTGKWCCGANPVPAGNTDTNGNPSWNVWCANKGVTCASGFGFCNTTSRFCQSYDCPSGLGVVDSNKEATEMPVSSAVALIFVAFFVGIILSYVVYKFRKNKRYVQTETAQALSESSRQSAEDSHLGERPLNVAPLSEQV